MDHDNPYRATLLRETRSERSHVVVALWWFVYLHPVTTLTLIYTSWILTATSLGRAPGFGEHPDNDTAHVLVHVLGTLGALLSITGPILIPIALMWGLAQPFAQPSSEESTTMKRMACVILYLSMLAIVASIYSFDPFGAVYWFWD